MSRRDAAWLAVVLGLIAPAGCSHLVETRSVTRFTGAFEDRDISALRDATSPEFQKRALRDKSAVEAMDLLELPEGKVSVAEVEEVVPVVVEEVASFRTKVQNSRRSSTLRRPTSSPFSTC